jgi:hypothetical protein
MNLVTMLLPHSIKNVAKQNEKCMIKGWSICSGQGVVSLDRPEVCFWPFLGWLIYTGLRVVNMTGFSIDQFKDLVTDFL